MKTYLLDTNAISDIANRKDDSVSCYKRLRAVAEEGAYILLPTVGVAEIEFGLQKGGDPNSVKAQAIRQFLKGYPHLPFSDDTVEPYALIRAWLFRKYGTRKGKGWRHKERLPEELKDRVTGKELGIDERDLLIASAAVQYNCVLVTNDNNEGMRRIREAANALASKGHPTELRVQNWR